MAINGRLRPAAEALPTRPRNPLPLWLQQPGRPGLGVAWGLLLFAAVWLTHLSLNSLTPPIDNIEQLNWVHALQWGYYKHPPLPTWMIWMPTQLFGANAWTSYATGAACTLATVGVLWWLLSELRGHRHATLAILAVLCMSYYNARLHVYNHDTMLALLSTVSAALCWKACTSAGRRWWLALGVALGLGALAKYQIAITMLCVLAVWLARRGWRDVRQRRGILLAALVALLIFVPHLQWLRNNDFGPIQYALGSSLGLELSAAQRLAGVFRWLVDQLCNRALAAWLLLAFAVYALGRHNGLPGAATPVDAATNQHDAGRTVILCWAVTPLVLMPLVSMFTGARLHLHWGSPFLLFAVPALMELCAGQIQWARVPPRSMLKAFVVIQLVLLTAGQLSATRERRVTGPRNWHNFDSQGLARIVEATASEVLSGGAICVVSGTSELAGAIALKLASHPLVLIDGRYDISPWVDRELAKRCGLLQLQAGPLLPDSRLVGPSLPGVWWRVVAPEPLAPFPFW